MSKIWITSEYYFPDLTSSGYYLTQIAEKLGEANDVEVLCATPHFKEGQPIKFETTNGIRVRRLGKDKLNKNRLLSRVVKFVLTSFRFFGVLITKVKRSDVLVVVTNPAPMIIISGIIKTVTGCRLVILIHDVFPENLVATKLVDKSSFGYRLVLNIFNRFYQSADEIVVCGRDMADLFTNKLSRFKGQISFIPNWADPGNIYPSVEKGNKIREKFRLGDKFIFQFAGNLGRAQGIGYMMEAAKKIDNENVVFQFFGKGVYEDVIDSVSRSKNSILSYGGVFHRSESNAYLNACDVAVVSLEPGMKGLGVPSKTYNILAVGKPILYIGDHDSEIGLLIRENELGVVCEPGSVDAILAGMEYFTKVDSEVIKSIGERGRLLAKTLFSMDEVLLQYQRLIGCHVNNQNTK